jgi:hypothetical protein
LYQIQKELLGLCTLQTPLNKREESHCFSWTITKDNKRKILSGRTRIHLTIKVISMKMTNQTEKKRRKILE